ncbi:MAG: hypothetical protein DWP95_12400, partial [Proteobacteria bacterium]
MKTIIALTFILLTLTACGNQQASIKQYYRINADQDISLSTSHQSLRASVVISRPKALSILGGRPMVATKTDGALVQLNNHYWLESPTILLHDTLKNWAEHHWQHIQTSAAFNERHDRLDTQILAFEKDGKYAKVSLQFVLTDADGHILIDQTLTQNLTIQGDGYAHFVQSINLAVTHILSDLNQTLNSL